MIKYGLSSLGRPIVIEDEIFSPIRITFIITTFCIGLVNVGLVIKYFKDSKKIIHFKYLIRQNPWMIYTAYILHVFVHTFHYIDNIARPVAYFEPKYLYQKYILSPMEITFYFNIPLTFSGIIFMKNLYKKGYVEYSYLSTYVCSSLMTLMHYRIESPSFYSPLVNFSIVGEGLTIFLFICSAFMIEQQPQSKNLNYKLFILLFISLIVCLLILTNVGWSWAIVAFVMFAIVILKVIETTNYIF